MSLLNKLLNKLEKKTILNRDGSIYLERYYILHSKYKWIPGVYLHKFLSSDEDVELHSHPWGLSISLLLSGRYLESRRMNGYNNSFYIKSRIYSTGDFNAIRSDNFHRVELITPNVWTLFLSGNKEHEWGFWDRVTTKYTQWEEFKNNKSNLGSTINELDWNI